MGRPRLFISRRLSLEIGFICLRHVGFLSELDDLNNLNNVVMQTGGTRLLATKGRKPSIDAARVREMKASAIAESLGIGRTSVYRVLEAVH